MRIYDHYDTKSADFDADELNNNTITLADLFEQKIWVAWKEQLNKQGKLTKILVPAGTDNYLTNFDNGEYYDTIEVNSNKRFDNGDQTIAPPPCLGSALGVTGRRRDADSHRVGAHPGGA